MYNMDQGGNMMHYSDDASDFVLLSEAVPDAILEIRYHSTYNFVGDRIEGYEEPIALLTKEAAYALRKVSEDLIRQGFTIERADGVVMGQIPGSEEPYGLGITLAKDSALTPFVTDAMNAILDDGTVQGLIDTWLKAYTSDIPVLA